jgi:hypothetical protein
MGAAIRILRYLKKTSVKGIQFRKIFGVTRMLIGLDIEPTENLHRDISSL